MAKALASLDQQSLVGAGTLLTIAAPRPPRRPQADRREPGRPLTLGAPLCPPSNGGATLFPPSAKEESVVDDAELVRIWQGDDESAAERAFNDLYRRLAGWAKRYARSLVGQDEPEVTSKAWQRVIRARRRIHSFSGYLAGAILLEARDVWRRNKNNPLVTIDPTLLEDSATLPESAWKDLLGTESPEAVLLFRDLVEQAMAGLEPRRREVFVEHHYEGMTTPEIAEKHNLEVGKVKRMIEDAKRVIREQAKRVIRELGL
jgi:RNA polymerase sigma factor (sigma-70 family)